MLLRVTWGKVEPDYWEGCEAVYRRVTPAPGLTTRWLVTNKPRSGCLSRHQLSGICSRR